MLQGEERDQKCQRVCQVNGGLWASVQTVGLEGNRRELSQPVCIDGSSRAGKQGGYLCAPANNDGLWLMT